ncbi:MAG: desulfoferrodoxin family protein [Petrotogales bacterium]
MKKEKHVPLIETPETITEGGNINLKVSIGIARASVNRPNTSTVYTHPEGNIVFRTGKPEKIIAFSYCNIHGL